MALPRNFTVVADKREGTGESLRKFEDLSHLSCLNEPQDSILTRFLLIFLLSFPIMVVP